MKFNWEDNRLPDGKVKSSKFKFNDDQVYGGIEYIRENGSIKCARGGIGVAYFENNKFVNSSRSLVITGTNVEAIKSMFENLVDQILKERLNETQLD